MRTLALILFVTRYLQVITTLEKHPRNHKNWNLLDNDVCGENLSNRIIGGEMSELGQFPWLAKLGYITPSKGVLTVREKRDFKCGGSLISRMYVLTAAHCVTDLAPDVLALVRVGEFDVDKSDDCDEEDCAPAVQNFVPEQIIIHKEYDANLFKNDIALIRLDKPAKYNPYVSPICLPYGKLLKRNLFPRTLIAVGWGVKNMTTMQSSNVPLYVEIPLVPLIECLEKLELPSVSEGQLCVGGTIGHDSCTGDSGGPLIAHKTIHGLPRHYQLGIVSFGSEECGKEAPAIYTDVTHYMIWILDHLKP